MIKLITKLFSREQRGPSLDELQTAVLLAKTPTQEKLARVIEIQKELDIRKAFYAEYDALLLSLAHEGFGREFIGDLVVELKDNFRDKNTSFTSAGVKRYELEVITRTLFDKRQAKLK